MELNEHIKGVVQSCNALRIPRDRADSTVGRQPNDAFLFGVTAQFPDTGRPIVRAWVKSVEAGVAYCFNQRARKHMLEYVLLVRSKAQD